MKIDKKITGYKVNPKIEPTVPGVTQEPSREFLPRPEKLIGETYKLKIPGDGHALYITINDIVIENVRHPYEIFINSKNMEHYQWVTALTRVISAVFRKGGNTSFLAEELQAVFDPKGGYFKKGEGFVPSVVADIGGVIAKHLRSMSSESLHEEAACL